MKNKKEVTKLFRFGIIVAFAVLSFVSTTVIRIPIPATGGYFNLGDTFVMLAALLYGPYVGFFVGLIGPTVSDAIGFPQFILATAIVKSLEGYFVGLIGKSNTISNIKTISALIIGIIIIVGGYFLFEAIIYPALAKSIPFFGITDFNAAIAELIPNLIQGSLSAIIAFGIWRALTWRKEAKNE